MAWRPFAASAAILRGHQSLLDRSSVASTALHINDTDSGFPPVATSMEWTRLQTSLDEMGSCSMVHAFVFHIGSIAGLAWFSTDRDH